MKTYVHLWLHLIQFFLKWEMFQAKVVEKMKTHFMLNNFFFRKSCHLRDNFEICGRDRQVTDDNIIRRMRVACWIVKATAIHTQNM
jgi:hypothetical protein